MIHLALPVLNESENLPALLDCIAEQVLKDFELVVCVNNYDWWWEDKDLKHQCVDNQESIAIINNENRFKINVIDRSSPGNGWKKKKGGVGQARKTAMDYIVSVAGVKDLIVSIDADTFYPENYLKEINKTLNSSDLMGVAVPYYHPLDQNNDRLILRYEIYMRYFLLNMLRIKNPYAYTALGSAMAFPVWAYKKVGGLTPVMSGEDFYFLQKLLKSGKLGIWTNTIAYPSPRFSDRVNFGTGPALIKGETGDWDSYPIYDFQLFDMVRETFDKFPLLFERDVTTPMDEFFKQQFNSNNIWKPLRDNYKDEKNFVKACVAKVDGLRILQFLKVNQQSETVNNSFFLQEYIHKFHSKGITKELTVILKDFDLERSPTEHLSKLREFLFVEEMSLRRVC